ncbi:cytochrome P450 [Cunninghamella echinulata]|nr:cytochrome P450 [Cunninghamella echinulata]
MDLLQTNKNQSLAVLTVVSTTLAAYYLFKSNKDNTKATYDEVPVPKSCLPYVGHLLSLGKLPGKTITKWHQEYGSIINIKMGVLNYYAISDPVLIHELLVTNGAVTSDRPNTTYLDMYTYNGKGMGFCNAHKKWKSVRTAALDILSPRKVDEFAHLITFEADILIKQFIQLTKQKGQLNPLEYIQSATLNVILQTTFGNRVQSVDDPLSKEILYNVNQHMKFSSYSSDISSYLPALSFLDVLYGKKRRLNHFVKTSYHPCIKKLAKLALDNKKDCFYTRLLELKEQYGLDHEDILVAVSDILLGGSDTSAVTLSWAIAILSQHPDIQKKITKEIDEYIAQHGQLPTFKDRDQFQYLITVLKEILRFKPVTALGVPHVNKQDVILRNYFIPKNSVLITSMEAMHRNPAFFEDPNTFNPDRYINKTNSLMSSANGNINDRDQYNFGWGRRMCPAIHLAESEMFYILTRMFAHTTIAPPLDKNGNEVPVNIEGEVGGLIANPLPFEVRFLPRADALL